VPWCLGGYFQLVVDMLSSLVYIQSMNCNDQKEYLVDIFTKEPREEKRDKIYKRYLEVKKNRRNGNVKKGNITDLLADIDGD
jgi:hypothetical protein